MKTYKVIKSDFLSPEDIDIINHIKHLSEISDNTTYDVYLGDDTVTSDEYSEDTSIISGEYMENTSVASDSKLPLAYLCSYDNHFVGYLTVFFSSENDINLYACVLPDYRNKGIFSSILNEVTNDIKNSGINPGCVYFPINKFTNSSGIPCDAAIHYLTKHGYSIAHIEYKMCYYFNLSNSENTSNSNTFDNLSDCPLELLTRDYDENTSEFTFWIGDDYIGGCMLYKYNDKSLCIFDYEIEASKRGNGYGKYGLKLILNYLAEDNYNAVSLHVSKANKKACSLYQSYGFIIEEEVDYYSL
ncbi:MAG: GNAT family N-acetyltransferase [Lachnospiraceae bacterium]|nr:GNAT family N-acetyltransferase [Eubacteriales bacterium]MDY2607362.1 GNAT family N-acetyltransferase [Lachnospiraceae bacterium]